MSKIMAINAGSTSLKFKVFTNDHQLTVVAGGVIERIGLADGIFTLKIRGEKYQTTPTVAHHQEAVQLLLDSLVSHQIVDSVVEITLVGHRVVQGGDKYHTSVAVTPQVLEDVEALASLAPLHNPANLMGYQALATALPHAQHAFVFDTAFHQTMEAKIYTYPLPYQFALEKGIRKYGAHGTSHQYVALEGAKMLGKSLAEVKLITCHLGGGASMCAIDRGKVVNTSMGFTPLSGLMMGTRSGDLDPSILLHLLSQEGMTVAELQELTLKQSGLLGVSGVSHDFRDIYAQMEAGNPQAQLAIEIFVQRIVDYIAQYYFQLQGVDAIIFTGGIGENEWYLRQRVAEMIAPVLQVAFDQEANKHIKGENGRFSQTSAPVQLMVVATDEELMIARDTREIYNGGKV